MKAYMRSIHYSRKELEELLVRDLVCDAEFAEKQAADGSFCLNKGVTKEGLLDYARECREKAKTPAKTLSGIHLQFFTPGRDC